MHINEQLNDKFKVQNGCCKVINLSNSDCMTLERFLRLAAKKMQGFHVRTRTDISLSMLGWKSVVSQIDYRKQSFLGRLCNMPNTVHAKGIFNARLSIYICRSDNNQRVCPRCSSSS